MAFPKHMKDIVYNLLNEPTLENFRDFLQEQTGEHDSIDFKGEWIEKAMLAKEILAMANSGGGIIVFGVTEKDDNTFSCDGLQEIKDKATISNEIKNFISSNLVYEIYDYDYSSSEYEKLIGKKFQILFVEDTPEFLPFISKKEGGDGSKKIHQNVIYVRKGTSCEQANEEDINKIINRKINNIYPNNGQPLTLEEHLVQLKTLYSGIERTHTKYVNGGLATFLSEFGKQVSAVVGKTETVVNPLYPEESYEEYISRMITSKKKKIERVLELK
ncbi:MAG: ATP-binding protein [Clostridia bacterium]|nr:ATP-binding protein [Clostridia bacterium]